MIRLYDLAGADPAIRFSPHCWRIRMALAHKGLAVETVPWRFTDKAAIAFSGQQRVPVLVDGDSVVVESWDIAHYLDRAYPQTPPLFAGAEAAAHARFIMHWTERVVQTGFFRQVLLDIYTVIADGDRAYFRESREARLGMTLELAVADVDDRLPALREALTPLRVTVQERPFLGGVAPSFADYIAFGAFQWARVVSPRALLADDDPILRWRQAMLDLYDSLAGRMPARPA